LVVRLRVPLIAGQRGMLASRGRSEVVNGVGYGVKSPSIPLSVVRPQAGGGRHGGAGGRAGARPSIRLSSVVRREAGGGQGGAAVA
jgi:hypothetical protein